MRKQSGQIIFKICREQGAGFPAQLYQTLFTGMGLTVQRKQQVKVRFLKFGSPVIDADKTPAFCCFPNLQLIGRHSGSKQLPVPLNDIRL